MNHLSPDEIRQAVEDGRQFAVRACGTCRHRRGHGFYMECNAVGRFAGSARMAGGGCGPNSSLWEARPPRQRGIFERAWRYLFGGRA